MCINRYNRIVSVEKSGYFCRKYLRSNRRDVVLMFNDMRVEYASYENRGGSTVGDDITKVEFNNRTL